MVTALDKVWLGPLSKLIDDLVVVEKSSSGDKEVQLMSHLYSGIVTERLAGENTDIKQTS